jgi:hypothetical protein
MLLQMSQSDRGGATTIKVDPREFGAQDVENGGKKIRNPE